MSNERVIQFARHPAFLQADWETRNPFLTRGEVGFEIFGGQVYRYKVGPGFWNDIPYQDTIYDFEGEVLTPIGDATGDLSGKRVTEILRLMLNGYAVPIMVTPVNNAGTGYLNTQIREIGQSINSVVTVIYS